MPTPEGSIRRATVSLQQILGPIAPLSFDRPELIKSRTSSVTVRHRPPSTDKSGG